jgi:hypothetical protein
VTDEILRPQRRTQDDNNSPSKWIILGRSLCIKRTTSGVCLRIGGRSTWPCADTTIIRAVPRGWQIAGPEKREQHPDIFHAAPQPPKEAAEYSPGRCEASPGCTATCRSSPRRGRRKIVSLHPTSRLLSVAPVRGLGRLPDTLPRVPPTSSPGAILRRLLRRLNRRCYQRGL